LSLGNPHPPGMDEILDETANEVGVSRDNLLKLKLLQNYQQLTEDLLQIQDLRNVKFLPQMHVLTWANKQKV
jgi:organic radical activating enzyme